jgi:mRNA interferase RelE/StbE
MSKTLVFSGSAAKSFGKLTPEMQERIYEALFSYGAQRRGDVKRMKGDPALRIRVGDYRIIFDEHPNSLDILALGDRRDIYR